MINHRVAMVARALLLSGLALLATPAFSQQWPIRPIRIVAPFPPGQGADVLGRLIAEQLTPALGQQVIVDNRPGAGGAIGTEAVAKSPPDGYTLLIGGSGPLAISPSLYSRLGYDTTRDFAPITNLVLIPMVFCVNPALPARDIRDLVRLAKRQPGRITYGSSGNGSTAHLTLALFEEMAHVKLTHVPYKGSMQAITDLIGGEIALLAESTPPLLPHIKSGRICAIGVSMSRRIPMLPEVETLDEQGVRGFNVTAWASLVAPAGTSDFILDRLNAEVVKIIHKPGIRKRLDQLALIPVGDTRGQFGVFLKSELAKWSRAVAISGARVD